LPTPVSPWTAALKDPIGAPELIAVWKDPGFDPAQPKSLGPRGPGHPLGAIRAS